MARVCRSESSDRLRTDANAEGFPQARLVPRRPARDSRPCTNDQERQDDRPTGKKSQASMIVPGTLRTPAPPSRRPARPTPLLRPSFPTGRAKMRTPTPGGPKQHACRSPTGDGRADADSAGDGSTLDGSSPQAGAPGPWDDDPGVSRLSLCSPRLLTLSEASSTFFTVPVALSTLPSRLRLPRR